MEIKINFKEDSFSRINASATRLAIQLKKSGFKSDVEVCGFLSDLFCGLGVPVSQIYDNTVDISADGEIVVLPKQEPEEEKPIALPISAFKGLVQHLAYYSHPTLK